MYSKYIFILNYDIAYLHFTECVSHLNCVAHINFILSNKMCLLVFCQMSIMLRTKYVLHSICVYLPILNEDLHEA